ncbi:MAG: hypothetical protein M0R06_25625 [Sphaerochaeta sp.]|jgi:hypothetical protein|nr:hypothetical protein [Sphaerochaeta sp.]
MKKIEEYTTLDAYPEFLITRAALNDIIEASSWLTDEVSLRFNKDGMWARFTDPAHVSMTELNLPKEKFVKYDFLGEAVLNIDMDTIKDLLRHVEKSEKVFSMRAIETPSKHKDGTPIKFLAITVDSPFDSAGCVHYGVPLLKDELPLPKYPTLTLPATIPLNMPLVYKAAKILESFTDHVVLEYDTGILSMSSENDSGNRCITMAVDGGESPSVRSLFPMDYFMGFVKAHKNAKGASLNMGTDLPMVLMATMPSGLTAKAAIAPRIEDC